MTTSNRGSAPGCGVEPYPFTHAQPLAAARPGAGLRHTHIDLPGHGNARPRLRGALTAVRARFSLGLHRGLDGGGRPLLQGWAFHVPASGMARRVIAIDPRSSDGGPGQGAGSRRPCRLDIFKGTISPWRAPPVRLTNRVFCFFGARRIREFSALSPGRLSRARRGCISLCAFAMWC